jgi:hypothetical protein
MKRAELQNRLVELANKERDYQFLKDAFFNTQSEFEKFKKENKEKIDELNAIKTEKEKIKWELMSDQERREHLEYEKNVKKNIKTSSNMH